MTKQELIKIAKSWGYTLTIEITPNGTVLVDVVWMDFTPSKHTYGSMDAATHDFMNMLKSYVLRVVERIEKSGVQND